MWDTRPNLVVLGQTVKAVGENPQNWECYRSNALLGWRAWLQSDSKQSHILGSAPPPIPATWLQQTPIFGILSYLCVHRLT